MSTYLGIDIGGTNIKIATVSARGRVLSRGVIDTDVRAGAAKAFTRIHHAARSLAGTRRIAAVGIGCAGLIDAERGVLRTSPNLTAWERAPLAKLAHRHFAMPAIVENDATCAAFGEAFARGPRGRHLVAITLGTGVGGGIVADGRVVHGARGFAGEIGHMNVDPDGPRCRCGARGCLEAYAGSYGIVRAARAALRRRGRRRLHRPGPLTVRAVVDAARTGDAAAREALGETGDRLGIAIASVLNLLNPSVVVVTGGVAAAFDILEPSVRLAVRRHAFARSAGAARIELSQLGNDAAVVGAAMLARKRTSRPHTAPRARPV